MAYSWIHGNYVYYFTTDKHSRKHVVCVIKINVLGLQLNLFQSFNTTTQSFKWLFLLIIFILWIPAELIAWFCSERFLHILLLCSRYSLKPKYTNIILSCQKTVWAQRKMFPILKQQKCLHWWRNKLMVTRPSSSVFALLALSSHVIIAIM